MKPYVQAYWAKTKDFFSRPKVIKRTVIILTSAILLIFVLALVWAIYTKDEPVFVPEEVRGNIQEVITDGGEAIKTLSEPLGSAIVEAGYIHTLEFATDSEDDNGEATANWPTYTNEELGISFKYPEGWVVEDQDFDGLSEETELFITLDPVSPNKSEAQLFLEIIRGNLETVSERVLVDLEEIEKDQIQICGLDGYKYTSKIPNFEDPGIRGTSKDVIVERNGLVFVFTYVEDWSRTENRERYFEELLNGCRVY